MSKFFRATSIFGIIFSLSLFVGMIAVLAQFDSRIELAVDTADENQDGLLILYSDSSMGGEIGLPVGAGDINGDGKADVMFCAMYASAGPGFRINNGQVYFYLSDGRDSGQVDAAQNPANISTLVGADSGDLLGASVATGDINGDGIRDVAIGAATDDGPANSRFNSGAVYVVLGSRNFNLKADLNTLDGAPPPGVIAIYGRHSEARAGIWVDIGDVDGDGFGDIVMGSDQLNTSAGTHSGGACIIFGSPSLPQEIDLAAPPPGVRMTAILGEDTEDHWGSALHVGDINNDGIADVVVAGAIFRDSGSYVSPQDQGNGHNARAANFGGTRPGAGEVFVLYGSRNWPKAIDLRTPPASATHIIGAQERDLLGSQLHSADINGDGKTDLILGALQALAPDNRGRTGAVYVVYGSPQVSGALIDLAAPEKTGLRITTIYGENHLDCAGDSVRSFDINKDGMFDLFIGSPEHTLEVEDVGEERDDAGDTKLIFGQRDFLPAVVKLYDPPAGLRIFRLAGAREGDEMSYRLAGGDVDGDGFVDYIANAMHGDGFNRRLLNAGNVYIFSGKKLSEKLGMLPAANEPAPTLTQATLSINGQVVQQANAGQNGLRVTVSGTGFRPDTEFTINGAQVTAKPPASDPLSTTQRVIDLDENDPSIKRSVGPLVARARNTNPLSGFSNEITAGSLIGPRIDSIRAKKKSSGLALLKISGENFPAGANVVVLDASGQAVELKSVSVNSSDSITVKIRARSIPPSGTELRVRVVAGGIESNQVAVAAP